jgi:hypothetical protein
MMDLRTEVKRVSVLSALLLLSCGSPEATPEGLQSAAGAETPSGTEASVAEFPLPTPFLSGYAHDIRGEVLTYHSPVPAVTTSLLVRSEDRARSIGWQSQPVPDGFEGEIATFALMLGIDVNAEPRAFDLLVAGEEVLRIENPLEASLGDTLRWSGEQGVEAEFRVTLIDRYGDAMGYLFLYLPRALWSPGTPVDFEVRGESAGARTWFMVFREPMRSRFTLRNAPAVLRGENGETQALRLDVLSLEDDRPFRFHSPVGSVDTVLALGHSRFTLPVPAVSEEAPVALEVLFGDHKQELAYVLRPPRRIEIHLLHHTHLDIGYTHHQDEVEQIQWASLEEALRLGEESDTFPEGSRFVWIPEGIWPVDRYVRAHPGEKTERLMEGIRRGWIELDGMYAGLLTGLANEETLLHAFDAARGLSEMSGVPIESEMVSDIPGFSWGLVEAMAQNGVRYLSIGPNFGHRIGHLMNELGDRPFYWEGPSGQSRVLTWVSKGGYAWFHTGLGFDSITARLDEDKIFTYVDQLVEDDYPYDLTYLRYNIGSDNGPPDPGLASAVREWNERYSSPTLRISTMSDAFRAFEERYGDRLPTLRGDMTGHWEDGAASSARETMMVRRVSEALPQTEALALMRGVALDAERVEAAWRNVLLYYEHTWGSWNSISEPYSELTQTSWDRKRAFAEAAVEISEELRRQALQEPPGEPRADPAGLGGSLVEVFNTLPWSRTDLVVLSEAESSVGDRVEEVGGPPVPSQRLSSGELAFLATDVPAEGTKSYRVVAGTAPDLTGSTATLYEGGAPDGDLILTTSQVQVRIGGDGGLLRSIVHAPTGKELVRQAPNGEPGDPGPGLNRYLYVPGRDPSSVVSGVGGEIRLLEAGPLVWRAQMTSRGPGLQAPLVSTFTVIEGLPRIDLENQLRKSWVLDPEAVLFAFPFDLVDPEVWIDGPFGAYRPEADQLPGASKNYFSAQRWVDLSGPEIGVTVATLDAPLIQLGEIRTDPIVYGWLEEIEPSANLFSYLMNNYWETNYRAAQDDEVSVRYSLQVHDGYEAEAARRFGLEHARPLIPRVLQRD